MDFWLDLFLLMINTQALSFANPFFWLIIIIVFMQYRQNIAMEEKLFGRAVNNIWLQCINSVLLGLFGGIFGSIFLLVLGISLESVGIVYLWPIAIALLFIHPRFLCFAYAGGLVAAAALIIRGLLPFLPGLGEIEILAGLQNIHLPSLLALIGVLHLTESFLIYLSGHHGASPIYYKRPSGEILGGYSMQRFWPLPLTGLWALVVPEGSEMLTGGIAMPDWWPLLGTMMGSIGEENIVYLMIPLVAGLGYGDLALSSYPHHKRLKTAKNLALYSIILSAAAIAAVYMPPLILPAALLAPLGHEYIIKKGNRDELVRPPLFTPDDKNGLKILAIIPSSLAEDLGFKSGDRLLKVNDIDLYSEHDFWNILQAGYPRAYFKVKRGNSYLNLGAQIYPMSPVQFGIIFTPGRMTNAYVEMKKGSFLKRFSKKMK